MKITDRIRNGYRGLTTNSLSESKRLARDFLKYGNDKMVADWSQTVMQEQDKYTGYLYAAITNRAKKVALLGEEHLATTAAKAIMDKAKNKDEPIIHPYLNLINESPTFTNYQFWYNISTWLDLKGVYYLLAVRNKGGQITGDIQEFELINPYNVKRVVDERSKKLQGYVEGKDGLTREIPAHMIIEVRPLNPFEEDKPYSMSDAAKDSQFTISTAGDHTRHSVQKNRATQGIVVVNDETIALDEQKMTNFKARLSGKRKGDPIIGFGKGSIAYDDMQIDLNKSALDKVNEVHLKQLSAVTGNSKTIFGLEESGTTRDTSENMKNNFINDHAVPQMKMILGALNQDYKNSYKTDYDKNKYQLNVNSPSLDESERVRSEQDTRQSQFNLYTELKIQGYSHAVASKYAEGKMELDEIDEPTEEREPSTTEENHDNPLRETIHNLFEEQERGVITQQQGALENAVKNIERRLIASVAKKVQNNKYDSENDIVNKTDRKEAESELNQAIQAFYLVIVPLYARRIMSRRAKEFGKSGVYSTNTNVRRYIRGIASKTSKSHIDTVMKDLFKSVQEASLSGASQTELVNAITSKYGDIAKTRAKAIARTETNRAFTQSQFQSDLQFLEQNDLSGRAYKKWITRSDNPCPICLELASRPPVPFKQDFLEFGSELVVTYKDERNKTKVIKQKIDYEPLQAGNAHTNCSCAYQLIIE